ncbi:MAG: peptidoglycan DD-metalloendopeptidase family protein [Chitinispirillaceae bacterium]|nr:peptidoglycan DD-metalloendopeptidase family protein [Chitinispirillaceae bacterium]
MTPLSVTADEGGGYDHEIQKKADKLALIKKEIDQRRKTLQRLFKKEGNYLARLENLEKNINASRGYLRLLGRRIDTAETTIARLTDSLDTAMVQLSDRQAIMKRRLRAAYMTGTPSPLMAFFMARSPLDVVNRIRYLEGVHRYDRDLVSKIDHDRRMIDEKKQVFEEERARLATMLRAEKREQRMLVKEEASRKKLLRKVRNEKRANQAMIADLEAVQRELNDIIRALQAKKKGVKGEPVYIGSSAFARQKGRLSWPFQGTITARFGKIVHPLYRTVTMNNGIDIKGRSRAAIHAVASGTVIYTGSMRGLGRIVIVDHGHGYLTIYARLESLSVASNSTITEGTIVGRCGADGLMHFEIRKGTGSLNPQKWLVQR